MRFLSAGQVAKLVDVPKDARPYYRALAAAVRGLVQDGRIPVRMRMPAERHLAETLQVSRTTVTAAYDLLREEGYLDSRQGSGSWTALPDPATSADNPWLSVDDDGLLQLHCAAPAAPSALREAMLEAVDDLARYGMGNGYDPMGLPRLRERVAAHYTARGVATRPEQILITTGSQHAMQLVMGVLTGPGDTVLVESPTYPHAIDAARQRGARVAGVGISHEGWQPDLVAGAMRQSAARLAYLMPDFHNPTGALMDDATRAAVAGAARRNDTMLLIDETWAELAMEDVPRTAPLAAFDTDSRVISIGSASKLWWGGLRIGWVRTTAALARRLAVHRAAVDIASPVLDQLVVARLFDRLEETRAERRRGLRASRDALVAALREHLPGWSFAVPRGGGTLWIRLDAGGATPLAEAAACHGVRLAPGPGSAWRVRWSPTCGCRSPSRPRCWPKAWSGWPVPSNWAPWARVRPAPSLRRSDAPGQRGAPAVLHGRDAQHEGEHGGGEGGAPAVQVVDVEDGHRGRAERGGHRVELAVVEQGGDLADEDVAQHTAADGRGDAQQRRVQRVEPRLQRLLGADGAEQAETRGVEHHDDRHDPGHVRMPEGHDHRGRQRHQHVAEALEGGGSDIEDQVAHHTAAEGRHLREHRHSHDVEPFAHPHERTGQGEDEDADQVENFGHGGNFYRIGGAGGAWCSAIMARSDRVKMNSAMPATIAMAARTR